jgi:hypothetical protein
VALFTVRAVVGSVAPAAVLREGPAFAAVAGIAAVTTLTLGLGAVATVVPDLLAVVAAEVAGLARARGAGPSPLDGVGHATEGDAAVELMDNALAVFPRGYISEAKALVHHDHDIGKGDGERLGEGTDELGLGGAGGDTAEVQAKVRGLLRSRSGRGLLGLAGESKGRTRSRNNAKMGWTETAATE